MKQEEYAYKEKKLECYRELKKQDPSGLLSIATFEFIFDRAYAFSREKETIPQEDIENAAKKYAAEVDKNVRDLYGIEEQPASLTFGECAAESFREGVKFALGKQEKDTEDSVIQGWVAIDEAYNQCFLHTEKPIQKAQPIADTGDYDTVWYSEGETYLLDVGLFPDMDIMAMPWVEDAVSADEMIDKLAACFGFSEYWIKHQLTVDRTSKPNGRVVYTVPIHGDFYLDINVIQNQP